MSKTRAEIKAEKAFGELLQWPIESRRYQEIKEYRECFILGYKDFKKAIEYSAKILGYEGAVKRVFEHLGESFDE